MLVGKTWVRDAVRGPSCTASGRPRSVRHITLTVSQNSEHPVNISYMRKVGRSSVIQHRHKECAGARVMGSSQVLLLGSMPPHKGVPLFIVH